MHKFNDFFGYNPDYSLFFDDLLQINGNILGFGYSYRDNTIQRIFAERGNINDLSNNLSDENKNSLLNGESLQLVISSGQHWVSGTLFKRDGQYYLIGMDTVDSNAARSFNYSNEQLIEEIKNSNNSIQDIKDIIAKSDLSQAIKKEIHILLDSEDLKTIISNLYSPSWPIPEAVQEQIKLKVDNNIISQMHNMMTKDSALSKETQSKITGLLAEKKLIEIQSLPETPKYLRYAISKLNLDLLLAPYSYCKSAQLGLFPAFVNYLTQQLNQEIHFIPGPVVENQQMNNVCGYLACKNLEAMKKALEQPFNPQTIAKEIEKHLLFRVVQKQKGKYQIFFNDGSSIGSLSENDMRLITLQILINHANRDMQYTTHQHIQLFQNTPAAALQLLKAAYDISQVQGYLLDIIIFCEKSNVLAMVVQLLKNFITSKTKECYQTFSNFISSGQTPG